MYNNISFSNLLNNVNLSSGNKIGNVETDNESSFGSILSKSLGGEEINAEPTMDMSDLFSGLLEGDNDMNSIMEVFFGMLGMGINGETSAVSSSFLTSLGNLANSGGGIAADSYSPQTIMQSSKNIPLPHMQNVIYGEDLSRKSTVEIPVAASKPTYPYLINDYTNRSASNYRQIINQFDVENNDRYKPYKKNKGDTYCNIFTWDVTRAMGAEIPHYIDPDTMEPMYFPDTEGGVEMSANSTFRWLEQVGQDYGWYEVTAEQAQALANQGRPAITAMKNTTGGSGHVQVVCPSASGGYDPSTGVTVAQAGSKRYNYTTLNNTTSNPSKFIYYAHI